MGMCFIRNECSCAKNIMSVVFVFIAVGVVDGNIKELEDDKVVDAVTSTIKWRPRLNQWNEVDGYFLSLFSYVYIQLSSTPCGKKEGNIFLFLGANIKIVCFALLFSIFVSTNKSSCSSKEDVNGILALFVIVLVNGVGSDKVVVVEVVVEEDDDNDEDEDDDVGDEKGEEVSGNIDFLNNVSNFVNALFERWATWYVMLKCIFNGLSFDAPHHGV